MAYSAARKRFDRARTRLFICAATFVGVLAEDNAPDRLRQIQLAEGELERSAFSYASVVSDYARDVLMARSRPPAMHHLPARTRKVTT